jgi:signal transduction histidine kinase
MSTNRDDSAIARLRGEGEMGTLMRTYDWQKTPHGPPEGWPQSLRTIANIVLSSRYAMWVGWGEDLTFFYNDAYRPTLGLKHPWALGRPAREVWSEIWTEIGPRIQQVLSSGVATYDEGLLLFLGRSGFPEETYHTFSYSPLADDNDAVCGMLCVVTEETDRIIGERRMTTLRDLAARLASSNTEIEVCAAVEHELVKNSKDLPFTLVYLFSDDGDAHLTCATNMPQGNPAAPSEVPAASNQLWPLVEILNDPVTRILDLGETWAPYTLPKGAWDKPPRQAALIPIKQQRHERPVGVLIVGINPYRPLDDAYLGFLDLISGQLSAGLANARSYEEERRRADALAELDRAKTSFFSNVSHEFRTPLTLMLGPVEDLLAKDSVEVENRELLRVVHRSGLRLQRLVNTLLDFSRIEAGRAQASYQPVDLAEFTADLASSFRSTMERAGIQFTVECGPLAGPVYVDCEMWEKVVLNLLSNAFKYTLEGSVTVRLAERDGLAQLSVADTGVGIPPEELPRLFERFHRVEQTRGRTHEGTGIGLALVMELIKLHHGTVVVESEMGRGSTFFVNLRFGAAHLPQDRIGATRDSASIANHSDAYVEEALRWLQVPSDQTVSPAKPKNSRGLVLLADDNRDMRDYVSRLLGEQYEVITAANGQEALALVHSNPPDLILCDVMMPLLDGFGLLRALRANPDTREVPVILLSARAGDEAKEEGLASGADDYLVKPFTARELLARVSAQVGLRRERQRAQIRLRQIFHQAPVGIIVLRGPDLIVELANPTYQTLLQGRDLVGRPFREAAPELPQAIWDAFDSVLNTGKPFILTDFHVPYDQNHDGINEDHWFNAAYHPLLELDGKVSGIIAVVAEVTGQVRARMELERVNQELEEFAYVSSHDLQEPLRMVSIYSQLLLEHIPGDGEEAQMYAGFVREGVTRMEALIKDLLTYSRIVHPEQDDPKSADLNESLKEAVHILKIRIDESGAVIQSEQLPRVIGEPFQLALVFQNLLSNAIKYRGPDARPLIQIRAMERDDLWVVSVEDCGIGFDPQHSERIFGLFKRLHKGNYPGTGLGLAICKRIIERYGGEIWATSAGEGKGAVFSFSLRKHS